MPDIVEIKSSDGTSGWVITQPCLVPGLEQTMVFKGPRDYRGWNFWDMGPKHWKIYKTHRRALRALKGIVKQQANKQKRRNAREEYTRRWEQGRRVGHSGDSQ